MTGWLDTVRAHPVLDVAKAVGLDVAKRHIWPCPACRETARSTHDRRPGAIFAGRDGWRCQRCQASGDGVSLAAAVLVGGLPEKGDRPAWAKFREAVVERGLCGGDIPSTGRRAPIRRPAPSPPRQRSPERMADARALWDAAWSPAIHDRVRRYCIARAYGEMGAMHLGQLGMMRGLSMSEPMPPWAGFGEDERFRSWRDAGWHALTPLYDATGALVDVRARWTGVEDDDEAGWRATPPPWAQKTMAGKGAVLIGTAWAPCPVARALLEDGPGTRAGVVRPGVAWDGTVWLCEGDGDAWAAAVALSRVKSPAEGWPAIFGYASGTWTSDLAARIPTGARVFVWRHPDEAGLKMGTAVARTLASRCEVHMDAGGEQRSHGC